MVGWKPSYTKGAKVEVDGHASLVPSLVSGPRVATLPKHPGQSEVSARPPRWENLEALGRNLGVGFGPVKPLDASRNPQENHRLDGAKIM